MRFGVTTTLLATLALIGPESCIAAGCPSALATARQDAEPAVEAAAIAWTLGPANDWPDGVWMCVTRNGGEAPGTELLHLLRLRYPALATHIVGAACKIAENGTASYVPTGERALTRSTGAPRFLDATHVEIVAGNGGCGDLCGGETKLVFQCGPDGWQVTDRGVSLSF